MKYLITCYLFLLLSLSAFAQSPTTDSLKVINYADFVRLSQQKGNDTTYLVNFWATWCRPCMAEIPDFVKLDSAYFNKKIKVIFISLDFPNNLKNVKKTAQIRKMNRVFLLDADNPNKWINETDEKWSGSIPATIIYQNGAKLFFHEGQLTFSELDQLAKKYIVP